MQAALVSLPTCLKATAEGDAPKTIAVAIRATVTGLGRITRAEVASPALQQDELACAKARVLAARLRAPVANGPTTIATKITLEQQPAKKAAR